MEEKALDRQLVKQLVKDTPANIEYNNENNIENPENKIKNIAIIRLSALGDIVHTIPAFSLLRQCYPHASIYWFAEPAGARLLQNIDGIDHIVSFNLKINGFFRRINTLRQVLTAYRKRFDLVIDFQGLLKSAIFSWLLKGHTLGFSQPNLREPQARFFYHQTVDAFDEGRHVIFKNIHLVKGLLGDRVPGLTGSLQIASSMLRYPLKELEDSHDLKQFRQEYHLETARYIIVNIGGGWQTKTLFIEQYLEMVEKLRDRYDYKIVILWGNEKEETIAREISSRTRTIQTIFLDFSDLIAFIRQARLIITADTLALHIADMVNTPSVAFFGPTSSARNGSLLPDSIAVDEKINCGCCYKKKCVKIECIKNLHIKKILDAVETINEKRY